MNRKHLATLATLAAVIAPTAAIADERGPAPLQGLAPGTPVVPEPGKIQGAERLVARVLAAEPDRGRLVVATERGMLELFASPDEVATLKVGDTIEIVMQDDPDAERPVPRDRT
jgi:hypothetical protein